MKQKMLLHLDLQGRIMEVVDAVSLQHQERSE